MDSRILALKREFERTKSFKDLFRLNHLLKRSGCEEIKHPIAEILNDYAIECFENIKKVTIEFGENNTNEAWGLITWDIRIVGRKAKPGYDHVKQFFADLDLELYKLENFELAYYGGASANVNFERPNRWRLITQREYVHYIMLKFDIKLK